MEVREWYARAAGGSFPIGKRFHCADTEWTKKKKDDKKQGETEKSS